jgi:hypothetical protein
MERLLRLLEATFGFARVTYLMAYCVYTGASALLHDVREGHDPAARRAMQTFLRALRLGVASCPLLGRSLHLIVGSLPAEVVAGSEGLGLGLGSGSGAGRFGVGGDGDGDVEVEVEVGSPHQQRQQRQHQNQQVKREPIASVEHGSALSRNYLPAFPYVDAQIDYASLGQGAGLTLEGFAQLDSFPEDHLDNITAAWYIPEPRAAIVRSFSLLLLFLGPGFL